MSDLTWQQAATIHYLYSHPSTQGKKSAVQAIARRMKLPVREVRKVITRAEWPAPIDRYDLLTEKPEPLTSAELQRVRKKYPDALIGYVRALHAAGLPASRFKLFKINLPLGLISRIGSNAYRPDVPAAALTNTDHEKIKAALLAAPLRKSGKRDAYPLRFKKQVVRAFIGHEMKSDKAFARKYELSPNTVAAWVKKYQ